ncbi:hypothetical protein [Chryseobacterium sp. FH1]|uniref:hypothetical protein n=1 Tax=Chryseobacterium sp. FH1 TaxID=1233951 RepID=UPI0004E46800|nr:hypothetical protein [Chryseobacterium sp. FH1]KFC18767.1 hypothetical protein IO90_17400 [Chryseobacterium sp. FH1]
MNLYKKIELKNKFHKTLSFDETYFEKVADYKISGSDYYINFDLNITQNQNSEINILYDDGPDSKVSIEFISEGIEKFLAFLQAKNISIANGLDFTISNTKNHPVDFKAKMFIVFTFKRLYHIFFRLATKTIQKPINNYIDSINVDVEVQEEIPKFYYNTNNFPLRNRIDLPINYKQNLFFLKTKLIKKYFFDVEDNAQIEISLISHYQQAKEEFRRIQYITILSGSSNENFMAFLIVRDVLEEIRKEIYSKNYNLSGIDIFINVLNSNIYEGYLESDFKYDLYFFIKEIILRSNSILIL